jgi:DNA repair exonuclease SbcCD ATPase subunit
MKISEVVIKNVMGLEELTIQPGNLTIIEGRNGVGKTSVLAALRALVSGGHDPSLIRKGCESAEVTMLLDDGVQINLIMTAGRSTRIVRHPKLGKLQGPQQYIDRLINVMSVDPVLFLTQKPKDRLATLLEAMPLRVTADQIGFLPAKVVQGLDLDKHALEVLGKAHTALYDERTGVNKAGKEKLATAAEMARTLPADPEQGDWDGVFELAKTELAKLTGTAQKEVTAIKDRCSEIKAEIDAETQEQIELLRAAATAKKMTVENERDNKLSKLQAAYTPKRDALNAKLTEAKTMLEQSAKAGEARNLIDRLNADASALENQGDQLSKALDKLQDLKGSMLEKTPIKGVTIQDGEILVDGVAFDRVNEARRIQIAIAVAKLRAGELPLVLVDDAEHFDSLNMEKFRKAAAKAGLQIVAAKVSDCDLRVEDESKSDSALVEVNF